MAPPNKFKEGSMWPKIGVCVLLFAFLLYLISFGSPHWARTIESKATRKEHLGLWRYCTYPVGGGEACNDFIDIIRGDWLKAAEAFETMALFTFLGAIVTAAIYAFIPDYENDMRILGAALGLIATTGVFILIGAAVFGGKYHEYFEQKEIGIWTKSMCELWWAFGINCCACILTFISLAFFVLDMIAGGDGY